MVRAQPSIVRLLKISITEQNLGSLVLKDRSFDDDLRPRPRQQFACTDRNPIGACRDFTHARLTERKNNAANAGIVDGAGTHRARLSTGIQR